MELDCDAPFLLKFHIIQNLVEFHLTWGDGACVFEETIGNSGFAVVNVGDDAEVADVIHARGILSITEKSDPRWSGTDLRNPQLIYRNSVLVAISGVKLDHGHTGVIAPWSQAPAVLLFAVCSRIFNENIAETKNQMSKKPLFDLKSFLARHPPSERPAAIFDCDGTIITGDIGEAMFYFQVEHFLFRVSPALVWPDFPKREELHNLYESLALLPREKQARDRRFLRFAEMLFSWYFDHLTEGATEKACSDIVRLLAGFSLSEVRQIAEKTLVLELSSPLTSRIIGRQTLPKGIRYIEDTLELLKTLQQSSFDIWVISGSCQWSVEAVVRSLGIPQENVVGIDLVEIHDELTATVKTPVPALQGKVEAYQRRSEKRPAIVVGDSIYDIPIFHHSSDLKILLNPQNGTSPDFFQHTGIVNDGSWVVVDRPTIRLS
jgi:phosphoserine phosphatase